MAGVIAQLTANARKRREGGSGNVAIEKVYMFCSKNILC